MQLLQVLTSPEDPEDTVPRQLLLCIHRDSTSITDMQLINTTTPHTASQRLGAGTCQCLMTHSWPKPGGTFLLLSRRLGKDGDQAALRRLPARSVTLLTAKEESIPGGGPSSPSCRDEAGMQTQTHPGG